MNSTNRGEPMREEIIQAAGGLALRVYPHYDSDFVEASTSDGRWGLRFNFKYRTGIAGRNISYNVQKAITRCWEWIGEQCTGKPTPAYLGDLTPK